MPHVWKERENEVAAGAICPVPDCGALVVAYRAADSSAANDAQPWEFTCPLCGTDFTVSPDELIFPLKFIDWGFECKSLIVSAVRYNHAAQSHKKIADYKGRAPDHP